MRNICSRPKSPCLFVSAQCDPRPQVYNEIVMNTALSRFEEATSVVPVVAPVTAQVCTTVPEYHGASRRAVMDDIARQLEANNAVLIAHYYTHEAIQELAEETGGLISDSLEMARFGQQSAAGL